MSLGFVYYKMLQHQVRGFADPVRSCENIKRTIWWDQVLVEILHCGEGGDVERWLESRNKSFVLVITFSHSLSNSNSLFTIACFYCSISYCNLYFCAIVTCVEINTC